MRPEFITGTRYRPKRSHVQVQDIMICCARESSQCAKYMKRPVTATYVRLLKRSIYVIVDPDHPRTLLTP